MPLSIRPASLSDCAAIARIYAPAVTHGTTSFELEAPDAAEMARRMGALTEKGFPYLIAELDNDVAGYAYAGPYRTRPAYRFTVENSIYVAPDVQRRGVGRALLERVEDHGRAVGATHVWLETSNVNVPEIAAYHRLGYSLCGADRLYYTEYMLGETAIYLAKLLTG